MAWSEWEHAKHLAAQRRTSQVELNSASNTPGKTGGLVSDRPVWARAGSQVGALQEGIGKTLVKLGEGQKGLSQLQDCSTVKAQKDLYDSWVGYLKKVSERCQKLSNVLQNAGKNELKTEEALKGEILKMKTAYADTAAVGGQGK